MRAGKIARGWKTWIHDKERTTIVYEHGDGETIEVTPSNRFSERYARSRYRDVCVVEREFIENASDPHAVGITLTGSVLNDDGGFRCHADYLEDLTASTNHVNASLRYALEGRRSCHISVVGGTREGLAAGYAHLHIMIWVDGPMDVEDFEGVVDSHVNHSPVAAKEDHQYGDCISVERLSELQRAGNRLERDPDDERDPLSPWGAYCLSHLIGFETDGGPHDADDAIAMFASTLWATNTRQYRPSRRFNEILRRAEENSMSDNNDRGELKRITLRQNGSETVVFDADEDDDGGGNGFEGGGGPKMVEIEPLPELVDPFSGVD